MGVVRWPLDKITVSVSTAKKKYLDDMGVAVYCS